MPTGKVGYADVADLACANERVEGREHFFGRRHGVETVQLEKVDVVRTQPLQGSLDRLNQMRGGGAGPVMLNACSERGLRGDNHSVTRSVLNGRAQNGFSAAIGIDIRYCLMKPLR